MTRGAALLCGTTSSISQSMTFTNLSHCLHGFYTDAGYNRDENKITREELATMKKFLWVFPVLAIGMAIGGLTLPSAFASTSTQSTTPSTQATQSMEQALSSPQGQAMIQSCESFMGQFNQNQK